MKKEEYCANCRNGFPMPPNGKKILCMRFPKTEEKGTGDWCAEYKKQKIPNKMLNI